MMLYKCYVVFYVMLRIHVFSSIWATSIPFQFGARSFSSMLTTQILFNVERHMFVLIWTKRFPSNLNDTCFHSFEHRSFL